MRTCAALSLSSVLLLLSLAACASADSKTGSSQSSAPPAAAPSEAADSETTFGKPSGLWDIPRNVQVDYFKAICTAPAEKFGYAGTYDESTGTCLTSNDMESDVDFLMRGLLASDARQMLQSTQMMVAQVGVPVEGCPTLEEYTTVADLTITNDCVIAAMKALTAHLNG
jgi:hypothetical protein